MFPYTDLREALEKGFINKDFHSKTTYLPELLVNSKKDKTKVLTTIIRELHNCDEFIFSVAFLTKSGVATLMNTFAELEEKEIKGKILVSQYQNFTQPEALRTLLNFKNIELKIVVDGNFHAKGYLFKKNDYYNLIIGSSNLTASALTSNKEWNLKVSAIENSKLIEETLKEIIYEHENAFVVDDVFINSYEMIYNKQKELLRDNNISFEESLKISPNKMQIEALANLKGLRDSNKNKALLISATATGKTYLSAFDVKELNPKKFLFLVHRSNIAKKAMESYKKIFGNEKTYGLYTGNKKEIEADFIFATIQTISKDDNLDLFSKEHFDYIVIDETHRAGAETYQKILRHFEPKFLLGMTATPERTDGFDIFNQFDYNIAYEIRLHRALEENMLSPFHYYGVTDISIDNENIEDENAFALLTSEERVKQIIEKSKFYGCDNGIVRGLIFCSSNKESKELSKQFNERGFKTIALSGESSESDREEAIRKLESDNINEKIDYIFSVDIFNEGIDIPKINQIIMLRPTQSAIVFVQQLGRGLRKAENKEHLTVIDFIGNYSNNYLVPIALYGDKSYNKDKIRKLIASGSSQIPGESTINFDKIAKDRIFKALDQANMQLKKDLINDYGLLKYKLGRIPKMMDFIEHSSRDAYLFVKYARSYYNFVASQEDSLKGVLSEREVKLLELFSSDIANGKRIDEEILLLQLLENETISTDTLKEIMLKNYEVELTETIFESIRKNLNFEFVTDKLDGKMVSVGEKFKLNILNLSDNTYSLSLELKTFLANDIFREYLKDLLDYSLAEYNSNYDKSKIIDGFILYKKYSRKDVFRILNWNQNPVAQNVGGYIISPDKANCPIFVNYHKAEDISSTTKYEDGFLNRYEFQWMSKSKRTLESPDVKAIRNYREGLRIPLFIKKSNDEDSEFYYMGEVKPIDDSFVQEFMPTDDGKKVSVVKMILEMQHPVDEDIYEYLTKENG